MSDTPRTDALWQVTRNPLNPKVISYTRPPGTEAYDLSCALESALATLRTRNAQLEAYESAWRKFVSLQTGDVQKLCDTAIELQRAEEELAALKSGDVVCVPREPTREMLLAAQAAFRPSDAARSYGFHTWGSIYRAMLAASQGRKQADAELFHDAYKRFRP